MTRDELTRQHWDYYLFLEKKFIQTIEYVDLSHDNFSTYSDTYALLIQTIGAELDTVLKIYCGYSKDERKSISDYAKSIDQEESDCTPLDHVKNHPFRSQKIILKLYNFNIQPFENWNSSKPAQSLAWWDAFDKLKHNRIDNKKLGNQLNCLNILGALYLTEMKMLKRIVEMNSQLGATNVTLSNDNLPNLEVCKEEEADVFDEVSRLFSLPAWTNLIPKELEMVEYINRLSTEADESEKDKLYDA